MSETAEMNWVFKILLLGDSSVGKTSLIMKYVKGKFKEDYKATLGVNIISKVIKVKQINAEVRLIIWDIAGQERYENTRQFYYEGCVGAFMVYDITRFSSFDNIKSKWLKDYQGFSDNNISYILIGNKDDLEDQRNVSVDKAKRLSEEIKAAGLIETSARSGDNVDEMFLKLVQTIFRKLGILFDVD